MSKDTFGMPGPGGSLGQCAVCGGNFIAEVLLGQTVKSVRLDGLQQELFLHKKCAPLLKSGMDWKELPANSPLRQAFEKANATPAPST